MTTWTKESGVTTKFAKKSLPGDSYILLENGSYLLLETGDKLFLENQESSSTTWTKSTT